MDIMTTIGPSSWDESIVQAHIEAGVSCIRFPFAKETPAEHVSRSHMVKQITSESNRNILTMADFPGGKPRLSNKMPISVSPDVEYRIGLFGNSNIRNDLFVNPPVKATAIENASCAIIGDGENRFIIKKTIDDTIVGSFEHSGIIERNRTFTLDSHTLTISSFTNQDRIFCEAAHLGNFDMIALSFVDCPRDVNDARAWLKLNLDWEPKIVAKIETRAGVENSSSIAAVADAVLIGRGDLAIHVGLEHLFHAQRSVIRDCRENDKYTIVATGFLESLVTCSVPSRSECIDVAAAIEMGANAIMLTSETTIGNNPILAVDVLKELIKAGESEYA